jgi:hypothetical protein
MTPTPQKGFVKSNPEAFAPKAPLARKALWPQPDTLVLQTTGCAVSQAGSTKEKKEKKKSSF